MLHPEIAERARKPPAWRMASIPPVACTAAARNRLAWVFLILRFRPPRGNGDTTEPRASSPWGRSHLYIKGDRRGLNPQPLEPQSRVTGFRDGLQGFVPARYQRDEYAGVKGIYRSKPPQISTAGGKRRENTGIAEAGSRSVGRRRTPARDQEWQASAVFRPGDGLYLPASIIEAAALIGWRHCSPPARCYRHRPRRLRQSRLLPPPRHTR